MTAELQAYGWERDGLIWRQTQPHLALVPERAARTPQNAKGGRDYRTSFCSCGGPKSPRAKECNACRYQHLDRVERVRSADEITADCEALGLLLDWWISDIPVAPLPVRTCDECGCLLHVIDVDCFVCIMRAERDVGEAPWRVTG